MGQHMDDFGKDLVSVKSLIVDSTSLHGDMWRCLLLFMPPPRRC
jgi:hypothetical protein